MIKCNVCGAANSFDSSVCAKCGAALRASRRNISTDSDNEIFSNTRTEELARSGEQRIDLFSSGEKYEKMRKGAVLEKIYKQEQAMGEVTELEEPPEPEKVQPIVINRQSSSDIIGKKKYSSKKGKSKAASKNYKIPQRIIEPVDSQLLGHKIKPQVTNTPEDENEKVELKASDPVSDIRNKNSSNRQNGNNFQSKQNSNAKNNRSETSQKKNSAKKKQDRELKTAKNNSAERKDNSEKTLVKDNGQAKNVSVKSEKRKPKTKEVSENSQKTVKKSTPKHTTEKAVTSETAAKKTAKVKNVSDSAPKAAKPKNTETTVKESRKTKPPVVAVKPGKAKGESKEPKKSENKSSPKSKKLSNYDYFTESDINSNKNLAALAYIGILFFIPLAKSGNSNFCKAHTKQGIAVFIYSLIISLLTLTAVIGLRVLLLWQLGLSYIIYNVLATAIGILMLVLLLIPVFSGAVSAFSGVYKSVPIVGKFVNKK